MEIAKEIVGSNTC